MRLLLITLAPYEPDGINPDEAAGVARVVVSLHVHAGMTRNREQRRQSFGGGEMGGKNTAQEKKRKHCGNEESGVSAVNTRDMEPHQPLG